MQQLSLFSKEFGVSGSKKKKKKKGSLEAHKEKASRRGFSCSIEQLQILAPQHPTGHQVEAALWNILSSSALTADGL